MSGRISMLLEELPLLMLNLMLKKIMNLETTSFVCTEAIFGTFDVKSLVSQNFDLKKTFDRKMLTIASTIFRLELRSQKNILL